MKLNVTNIEKLDAAITEAEGRASVRCINSADVAEYIARIEKTLSGILNKTDWAGLKFDCDPHGRSFPGSYKGIPESTKFTIERGSSAWFVTKIWRGQCGGPTQQVNPTNISSKAEQIAHFVQQSKNW
jgi:hypothetical protein